MRITLSSSAFEDLEGIKAYYLEQGVPYIGIDFVTAIFEHIQRLAEHPDSGRVVPEFGESHIREIIHPPFRVVYLRDGSAIQIIRVWRSERLLSLPED
ncbi:MAG: type II toxin-antitoxin system RelE/ParE family toxin [Amphritea sp.]